MAHRFTSDPAEVSERMKLIRSKNTKPELALFEILDDAQLSYEKHLRVEGISVDALVGDSIAVFVDSPFWHLRDRSELARLTPYWRRRLLANCRRDSCQTRLLRSA